MNREHGDSPLAAGVDRGRMFWTQAAAHLPMASLAPARTQGSPFPGAHLAQPLRFPLSGTWAFLQELRCWSLVWSTPPHPSSPIRFHLSITGSWGSLTWPTPDSTKSPKYGLSGQQGSPSQLSFCIMWHSDGIWLLASSVGATVLLYLALGSWTLTQNRLDGWTEGWMMQDEVVLFREFCCKEKSVPSTTF